MKAKVSTYKTNRGHTILKKEWRPFLWLKYFPFPQMKAKNKEVSKSTFSFESLIQKAILTIVFLIYPIIYTSNAQQFRNLQFEHISTEQGLIQATPISIAQDQQGYMWFGTGSGLHRYDGYSFLSYTHDLKNTNSISDDAARTILFDRSGTMWIGTDRGGLNRFDRANNRFYHYQYQPNNPTGINSNQINILYEDREGTIWVGTKNGLNILKKYPNKIEFIDFKKLTPYNITTIREDNRNTIWIGTAEAGLFKYNKTTQSLTNYKYSIKDPFSLSSNSITQLLIDNDGNLWIGTNEKGLNKFIVAEKKFLHYTFSTDKTNKNTISSNNINSIYEDRNGTIWVGTADAGLNYLEKGTEKFISVFSNPANPRGLNDNKITSLFEDKTGSLWIGTNGGGINKLDKQKKAFDLFSHNPNNKFSIEQNTGIRGFGEDSKGNIWVATHLGGLDKLDTKKRKIANYSDKATHSNVRLSSPFPNVLLPEITGNKEVLWIGTSNGLDRLNLSENRMNHFYSIPGDPTSLSNNFVRSILRDSNGNLWIGTQNGLNLFNRETQSFRQYYPIYTSKKQAINSNDEDYIYCMFESKEGELWLGNFNQGLVRFNTATKKAIVYKNDPKDSTSISNNRVSCFCKDKKGNIWIGTYGGGFNKLVEDTHGKISFQSFTTYDGLSNNNVYGILDDEQGNLWISTDLGVNKFNPTKRTFQYYDESDGLQDNEFNGHSYFKSRSGEMFFGGIKGFNSFYPQNIKNNSYIPSIAITTFKKITPKANAENYLKAGDTVKLQYEENAFTVEFAALDYTASKKNKYAYQLEGLDKEWIYSGTRNYVSYSNLEPGEYFFRVKGSNNDSVWNNKGTFIKIIIIAPFWKTIWFEFILIVLAALFVFALYRVFVIRKYNKKLTIEVTKQTAKLNDLNGELQGLNKELEAFSYSVSHDLRAPLRAINGYARILEEDSASKLNTDEINTLNAIQKNSKKMGNLIDDLLTFSRLGRTEIITSEINMDALVQSVINDEMALNTNEIEFDVKELLPSKGSKTLIKQVWVNLISNAIKYSKHNPKARIEIGSYHKDNIVVYYVEDNGAGFDIKYYNKLFGVFQRLHSQEEFEGTGIGLAIVHKIIQRHNGTVWAESKLNEGSCFYFSLPIVNS